MKTLLPFLAAVAAIALTPSSASPQSKNAGKTHVRHIFGADPLHPNFVVGIVIDQCDIDGIALVELADSAGLRNQPSAQVRNFSRVGAVDIAACSSIPAGSREDSHGRSSRCDDPSVLFDRDSLFVLQNDRWNAAVELRGRQLSRLSKPCRWVRGVGNPGGDSDEQKGEEAASQSFCPTPAGELVFLCVLVRVSHWLLSRAGFQRQHVCITLMKSIEGFLNACVSLNRKDEPSIKAESHLALVSQSLFFTVTG